MKKSRRIVTSTIGLTLLLALSSTTKASPIVYEATGSFTGGLTLSGTVEFDPDNLSYTPIANLSVSGLPDAQGDGDFTIPGAPPLIVPVSGDPTALVLHVDNAAGTFLKLQFSQTDFLSGGRIPMNWRGEV